MKNKTENTGIMQTTKDVVSLVWIAVPNIECSDFGWQTAEENRTNAQFFSYTD
jgi:hypothetical protein